MVTKAMQILSRYFGDVN